jgi:hypothetical protein
MKLSGTTFKKLEFFFSAQADSKRLVRVPIWKPNNFSYYKFKVHLIKYSRASSRVSQVAEWRVNQRFEDYLYRRHQELF